MMIWFMGLSIRLYLVNNEVVEILELIFIDDVPLVISFGLYEVINC